MIDAAKQQKVAEIHAMLARRYPHMSQRNRNRLVAYYVSGFDDGVQAATRMLKQT